MSVLIKGMEMPESCKECQVSFGYGNDEYCPFLFEPNDAIEDGLMWKECPKEGRLADCPLVEIPTPHGRLIDADAVNKAMDERIEKLKDDRSIYEASCVSTALDMFAPTVIEAEGSKE